MKKNNLLILAIAIVAITIFCYCITKSKESYNQKNIDQNIQQNYDTSQAQDYSYEMLSHPGLDGFGVGPAGSPGMTPEYSIL